MANDLVRVEIENQVARVTIDHPPVNSLSKEVKDDLRQAFEGLRERADICAVILTGAGEKAFAAGADIKQLAGITPETAGRRLAETRALLDTVVRFPYPVICAIDGLALGGGCELAMACDIRVASKKAKLGLPEVKLGTMPGAGGTQRLPRLVGHGKAMELVATGEIITAEEAHRIGLVDRLADTSGALDASRALGAKLAKLGKVALRSIKKSITEGLERPLGQGLDLEAELWVELCGTRDMHEGIQAFIEKREPRFEGK